MPRFWFLLVMTALCSSSLEDQFEFPEVSCSHNYMDITVPTNRFRGHLVVVGKEHDPNCVQPFLDNSSPQWRVRLPLLHCASVQPLDGHPNVRASLVVRISTHPLLVTSSSKLFHLECSNVQRSALFDEFVSGPFNTVCAHSIRTSDPVNRLGELMFHEWSCNDQYGQEDFSMWIEEVQVLSRLKDVVNVISGRGCAKDEQLISNVHSSLTGSQKITALSHMFRFPDQVSFRFKTRILLIPKRTTNRVNPIPDCSWRGPITFEGIAGIIETITLSDWIDVANLEEPSNILQVTSPSSLSLEDDDQLLRNLFTNNETDGYAGWRVQDIVLNNSNDTVTVFVASPNRNELSFNLHTTSKCSWRLLNSGLLVWSIGSVFIWLGILAFRFYRYLDTNFSEEAGTRTAECPSLSRSWSEPYRLHKPTFSARRGYLDFRRV